MNAQAPRLAVRRNLLALLVTTAGALGAALALLLLLGALPALAQSGVIFVDDDSVCAAACGASWADAHPNLQDALAEAATRAPTNPVEIWVAAGIYYPDEGAGQTDDLITATFQLLDDVAVYGGFAGSEALRSERNWETNVTVLSGDLGEDDSTDANGVVTDTARMVGSNAYHVVTGSGTGDSAILDGFTITAGHADGVFPHDNGGGMLNDEGNPTLTNLNFAGNYGEWGGGMANGYSSPALTNVSFISNTAWLGGGMYNYESDAQLTDVTFVGNYADEEGGGLLNDYSSPMLVNVSFDHNQAWLGGGLSNFNLTEPVPLALTFDSESVYAERRPARISRNTALVEGAKAVAQVTAPTLINVSFTENSADSGGGMINFNSSPVLTGVTFLNNSAYEGGGMLNSNELFLFKGVGTTGTQEQRNILNQISAPTLTNVSFISNSADFGGGMLNFFITPTLSNVSFTRNVAYFTGGGMANVNSSPILSEGAFTENIAIDGAGGGMYNVTVPEIIIRSGDSAAEGGEEIEALAEVSSPILTNVSFIGNRAVIGGGMYNEMADGGSPQDPSPTAVQEGTQASAHVPAAALTNVSFISNNAAAGGGMFNYSVSTTLTNVSFISNSASLGGGMFNDSLPTTLTNVSFISNSASVAGGMFNYSVSATLTGGSFVSNSAVVGGGIYSTDQTGQTSGDPSFSGRIDWPDSFSYYSPGDKNAEATANGVSGGNDFILVNISFVGNHAVAGGAMANAQISPTLTNVSFVANIAAEVGGAMYNSESDPTIQNSIFWNNEDIGGAGTARASIFNFEGSTPIISYSLVQGSGGSDSWESSLGVDGGANIDADPLFVREPDAGDGDWSTTADNDYGNLRLQPDSPAIDAGNNAADLDADGSGATTISDIPTDLAGNPRIVGKVVDMGAYEFQLAELTLVKSVTPATVMPGQALTYTLAFSNTGFGLASGVVITDILPAHLSDLDYQSTVAITPTGAISYSWQVGEVAPGGSGVIIVSGVVSEALSTDTSFTNTATIATTRPEEDLDNNSSVVVVSVTVPRISLSNSTYSVVESEGPATITINLNTANPYADVQVAYQTGDGTATAGSDYSASSGVVTVSAGETSAAFTIPILDDDTAEPPEDLTITLSDPRGATLSTPITAGLTIIDDDARVFLPLLVQDEPPGLPDLVVRDLTAGGDDIQVVIENVGEGPATTTFWVDFYIDPETPPLTVNDVWWKVADEGLVWGVDQSALPLEVGETLTLTFGDAYYVPSESNFSGAIAPGTPLYAQVDSAHTGTFYGGVLETHEEAGGNYNNILGPVTATETVRIRANPAAGQSPGGLPPR